MSGGRPTGELLRGEAQALRPAAVTSTSPETNHHRGRDSANIAFCRLRDCRKSGPRRTAVSSLLSLACAMGGAELRRAVLSHAERLTQGCRRITQRLRPALAGE